jgi:hypothetical protein
LVAHREHLWWLLAEAAQFEHMMMCQYLYAEFSLKDGSGGLTARCGERAVLAGSPRAQASHELLGCRSGSRSPPPPKYADLLPSEVALVSAPATTWHIGGLQAADGARALPVGPGRAPAARV